MHHADPTTLTVHPDAGAVPELSDSQYQALRASIDRHGMFDPILIDGSNRVIDGRHRLRAAIELGMEGVPVARVSVGDVALAACDAAVARRNLTASGRVLVLFLAHPALKRGAADRRHANLKRGAKLPDVIPVTSGESKEFATFETLADRYGVPREYFSTLAAIEDRCGAEEWHAVQAAILGNEASIPALNAGIGGKAATKGKKRSDPQYHIIAPRAVVTIGNSFKSWNKIPQDGRQRVLAEMRTALQATPDAVRALIQDSILEHWPEHEKAELAALLKKAGKKSGAF